MRLSVPSALPAAQTASTPPMSAAEVAVLASAATLAAADGAAAAVEGGADGEAAMEGAVLEPVDEQAAKIKDRRGSQSHQAER